MPLIYGPSMKREKRGSVTYSTDRENEVIKIFKISLRLTGVRARKLVKVKRKVQLPQTGFVQVMENLESHGIEVFQFPGLESHGI